MTRRYLVAVFTALIASLLSGCYTTTDQNISLRQEVTATLPEEPALRHLQTVPKEIHNQVCRISRRGLSGWSPGGFSLKPTGYRSFAEWRISGVGTFDTLGTHGTAIMLRLVGEGTQPYCFAYFDKDGRLTPNTQQALHKAVTALVSLGVHFDAEGPEQW